LGYGFVAAVVLGKDMLDGRLGVVHGHFSVLKMQK
jgi:hypothetical protein